jgi:hypothetical protein
VTREARTSSSGWGRVGRASRASLALLALAPLVACTGSRVTDPHEAAVAFAHATERADPAAIYAMLTPSAKSALSREDVGRLVKDEHAELTAEGHAVASPDARIAATARLRFQDGEEVALTWTAGTFRVSSGGTLPGGAPTPAAALDELRRAIARRSYPALLRILSPTTRSAIEQDLRTLTVGLEHPETLFIRTTDDAASAVVPGGHQVRMKREGGIWRVEDFD